MDPASLDPRLRDAGEDSIVVHGPANPPHVVKGFPASAHVSAPVPFLVPIVPASLSAPAPAPASALATAAASSSASLPPNETVSASNPSDISESSVLHHVQSHGSVLSPGASAAAFSPQTPTGQPYSISGDSPNAHAGTPPDPNDPKRPRACEACRGLKVKCEPDLTNPDNPCKRCAKANRNCVVTQPTRKRQKKTDNRVAELEKKIDALTASLQASRGTPAQGISATSAPPSGDQTYDYSHASAARDWGAPVPSDHQPQPRPRRQPRQYHPSSHNAPEPEKHSSAPSNSMKRKFADGPDRFADAPDASAAPSKHSTENELYPDIIDRGLLTMNDAASLFARYSDDMMPHLPAVIFPEDTTAAQVREESPILFLSIMAVASFEMPKLQKQLNREIMVVFADQIIISGKKSFELVQALLVSVIWYYPPETFEELKFYQFVHIAAVMSIDIGLGRKMHNPKSRLVPYTWRNHPFRKHPLPDSTTLEAKRAWLAVYFLTSNVSMALHRPNLVRWQPFMAECMDSLQSSAAAPTDRFLCHLVWTHRLAEDVGIHFAMDDPTIFVNITERKVQFALRAFELEFSRYSESIPIPDRRPSLVLSFHVLNLYMHEIALHGAQQFKEPQDDSAGAESLREPIPAASAESLTPSHVSALSSCLNAIDGILETFLSMDVDTIRCVPIFSFVRVAYAVVVLIKMFYSASNSNSELGRVINKDNMKVAEYLEKLFDKFSDVARSDKSLPATKFLHVLNILRTWFYKNGQNRGKPEGSKKPRSSVTSQPSAQGSSAAPPAQNQKSSQGPSHLQQQPQSGLATSNTPLHLLSEIATGNDPSRSDQNPTQQGPDTSSAQSFPSQAAWFQQMPPTQQQPPFAYDPAAENTMPNMAMASDLMPYMTSSFGTTGLDSLGEGFEQAMGLTLGGFGNMGDPDAYEDTMRFIMQNDAMMESYGPGPGPGPPPPPQQQQHQQQQHQQHQQQHQQHQHQQQGDDPNGNFYRY
ncbi:hypothetical protein GGR52DRAFT_541200 [Hypoxylon sp. FL1284]|nr:hypothetical protein GGR52DRAFT_541200 [Hypoxylon sp. FL1284]